MSGRPRSSACSYLLRMKVSEIATYHGISTTTVNSDLAVAGLVAP